MTVLLPVHKKIVLSDCKNEAIKFHKALRCVLLHKNWSVQYIDPTLARCKTGLKLHSRHNLPSPHWGVDSPPTMSQLPLLHDQTAKLGKLAEAQWSILEQFKIGQKWGAINIVQSGKVSLVGRHIQLPRPAGGDTHIKNCTSENDYYSPFWPIWQLGGLLE